MKPAAPAAENDFGKDLKAFERLPAKARELQLLKDQAERPPARKAWPSTR